MGLAGRSLLYSADFVAVVLAALLLSPFVTLLLLRSRRPKMYVSVRLGSLLRLHVTVSVDTKGGDDDAERD